MTTTREPRPSWRPSYTIGRRRFLQAGAAGAGGAFLLACGGGGDEPGPSLTVDPAGVRTPGAVVYTSDEWKLADETAQAVPGGVYPGRELQDLTSSWDPWLANVGLVEDFNDIGYEYLTRENRGPGIAPTSAEYTKIVPHLAESWEVSNDALTYTFTLRQGVKFHPIAPVNGRVMDIDDWRTTFERFLAIGTNRATLMDLLDKVEFPDARHMVVKMKAPYAPFLNRMNDKDFAFKIVPKELNANDRAARDHADRHQLPHGRQGPALGHARVQALGRLLGRQAVHRPLALPDHPRDCQRLRPVHRQEHHHRRAHLPRRAQDARRTRRRR